MKSISHNEFEEQRSAAQSCTACDLYKNATQTVFGEGNESAELMLVGEQPGDKEDLAGHPFVGPAGGVLDKALDAARIDKSDIYLTNIVKHFKWKPSGPSGKVRLHQKPNTLEVKACAPWFAIEVARVRPRLIVLLGATAAQALLGPQFRVTKQHGEVLDYQENKVLATIHPSAVLRTPDSRARQLAFDGLVADLTVASRAARNFLDT